MTTPIDKVKDYPSDIIGFLSDHYVLPETGKFIKLEDWQKDWILKPLFYDLESDGRRKYDIALIGMPKKNGKSALAAGIGVYFMYCDEVQGEIIVAANDKDQASQIIFTKIRKAIEINKEMKQGVINLKGGIEIRSTGTTCRCLAHQAESAAGLNPNLVLFDELWGFKDRKFYDELTNPPTRFSPLILIVTYAGYTESGLLYDLYKDGLKGEDILDTNDPDIWVRRGKNDPRMFVFWSERNMASWIRPQYLDSQRNRMPPSVFARLHRNKWVASEEQVFTEQVINAMYRDEKWMGSYTGEVGQFYVSATDLGLTHDRAARAVGHYDKNQKLFYLDDLVLWEGSMESHVQIKEVEDDLIAVQKKFPDSILTVDPWQMEYVIQRLQDAYPVSPFNFQADAYALSQVMVKILQSGRFRAPKYPILEEELRACITRQTARGWRLDHKQGDHNDALITVGMMLLELSRIEESGDEGDVLEVDDSNRPVGFHKINERTF